MSQVPTYENDPFFRVILDATWNACLGKQGDEENYLTGYIEAAIELTHAIIEKELLGKRDTLVLPILYNARHAIELTLKFTKKHLIQASILQDNGQKTNHNIQQYWDYLNKSTKA
jgi:hypothetical protein